MSKKKRRETRRALVDVAEFRAITIIKLAEEVARLNGGKVRADGVPTPDVLAAISEAEDLATAELRDTLETEALGASYALFISENGFKIKKEAETR